MRKKILIIDDDPDFREAVSSFLEINGFEVVQAENGARGLRMAKRERPDLVIMDIIMDERTEGFFAIQELRRSPGMSGVPVFVLSSIYSRIEDFTIAPERAWLEHDEFLAKPVNLNALLSRIRRRLESEEESGGAVTPLGET
jgi:DNA-binding response OmpR family regulator